MILDWHHQSTESNQTTEMESRLVKIDTWFILVIVDVNVTTLQYHKAVTHASWWPTKQSHTHSYTYTDVYNWTVHGNNNHNIIMINSTPMNSYELKITIIAVVVITVLQWLGPQKQLLQRHKTSMQCRCTNKMYATKVAFASLLTSKLFSFKCFKCFYCPKRCPKLFPVICLDF